MTPRRLLTALAVAGVLLLGGCATIPSDGPVNAGPTDQPDQPGLVFIPNPPANGDSPDLIVRGFVQAASQGGSFSIAKRFLTPVFAKRWKPGAGVLVHNAPWTPTVRSATTTAASIGLSVPLSGSIDATGRYTPASRSIPLSFTLEKTNGQWRITRAPDGILLTQDVFQRTFVPKVLQFWDQGFERLVPDLRWFPGHDSEVETVTHGLLGGAAAPLRGQVTASAFPRGARLVSASGSTTSATVALEVPGVQPSALELGRMWQQLSSSLQIAPADVTLIVNGRAPTGAPPRPVVTQPNTLPVVYSAARFGPLSATGVVTSDALATRIASLRPTAATVSPRQGFAAVRSGKGVSVVTRSGSRVVDPRADPVDPTVDQRGWTYSVPKGSPNGLQAAFTSGRVVSLHEVLPGAKVLSIEVSPDGTRMLVLLETASDGPLAFVAGIERAADGTPIGLTPSRYPVALSSDVALDATWVDDGSVAVLAEQQDQQTVTWTVLGGVTTSLGRIANATDLIGATGPYDLRARLNTGDLDVWRDNAWQPERSAPVRVGVLAVQR